MTDQLPENARLPEPHVEWAVEVTWRDWKKAGAKGPTSQYGPFDKREAADRFLDQQRRDRDVAATRVFERLAAYTVWDSIEEPEPTSEADRNLRLARYYDRMADEMGLHPHARVIPPESASGATRTRLLPPPGQEVEQILANDWHRDQCACTGWPKQCVGLAHPIPPMTWTVEAVLDALSRVPKPGDLAEDASLHVEQTGHSVTWNEECGLWGCHDCSWTDPNAPRIPPG